MEMLMLSLFFGIVILVPVWSAAGNIETFSSSVSEPARKKVFCTLIPGKNEVFVNEMAPLSIKLFIKGPPPKEITYPQFKHENLWVGEFERPSQREEIIDGIGFHTVEFKTKFFGKRPGNFGLGPVEMRCILPAGQEAGEKKRDYFEAYESEALTVTSQAVSLRVHPLPEEGRPTAFTGAVGNFNLKAEIQPEEVRAGDPVTLRIHIEGKGNFDTVAFPKIEFPAGYKIYEPLLVDQREDAKVYEQVIVPQTDTMRTIPVIPFSFFDPSRKEYKMLHEGPIPIRVVKALSGGSEASKTNSRKKGFFAYALVPLMVSLILLILVALYLNRRSRTGAKMGVSKKVEETLSRAERSLREGDSEAFYGSIFKTLQIYLGDRFSIPSQGITVGIVDELQKRGDSDEDWAWTLKDIFKTCDLARYGSSPGNRTEMEKVLKSVESTIRHSG